jgi:hypothetical protein
MREDKIMQTEPYTAQDVADFLNARDRTSASPVTVRIGRTTYVGASYSQTRDVDPGCRAYEDGERTYVQSGYYLLGALPASWLRRKSTLYVTSDDSGWFVGGWFGQDGETNDWHPFGRMFQLFPMFDGIESERPYRLFAMIVRAV